MCAHAHTCAFWGRGRRWFVISITFQTGPLSRESSKLALKNCRFRCDLRKPANTTRRQVTSVRLRGGSCVKTCLTRVKTTKPFKNKCSNPKPRDTSAETSWFWGDNIGWRRRMWGLNRWLLRWYRKSRFLNPVRRAAPERAEGRPTKQCGGFLWIGVPFAVIDGQQWKHTCRGLLHVAHRTGTEMCSSVTSSERQRETSCNSIYGLNMVELDLGVWGRQGRCRRGAGDEPLVCARHWARYLPAVTSSNSHRTGSLHTPQNCWKEYLRGCTQRALNTCLLKFRYYSC